MRDVALEIRQGEVVGLLGPNGAGKTTTFYMVVGLARPDSGQVFLGDEDITGAADVPARAGRDRLPAAGGERLPQAHRGGERARHPRDARACPRRSSARTRAQLLEELGHPGAWPASPPTRSRAASGGGSRSAARWPPRPSFILLDEPFAGIDPLAVLDIQKIIAHLRDRGIGILITDHNVRETLKITDRAYILRDGECLPLRHAASSSPRTPRCGASTSGEGFRLDDGRASAVRARPARRSGARALWRSTRSSGSPRGSRQRLILTPSLQQAIKLLPLTTLELAEVLEQEVMENPLLEEVAGRGDEVDARRSRQEEAAAEREKAEDPLKEIEVERFFEDYFDDGGGAPHAAGRGARGPADREHAHRVARPLRPPAVAAAHDGRRTSSRWRSARRSSRTSTRTGCCACRSRTWRRMGPWPLGGGGAGADARAVARPAGRGGARPHGVPAHPAPACSGSRTRPPTSWCATT